jgi:hypothetical protein
MPLRHWPCEESKTREGRQGGRLSTWSPSGGKRWAVVTIVPPLLASALPRQGCRGTVGLDAPGQFLGLTDTRLDASRGRW